MKKLLGLLRKLKKSKVKRIVDSRLEEFKKLGRRKSEELFREMCFCFLTANFNAERSIVIQQKLGRGVCSLPKAKLRKRLRRLGHRHPNVRAGYIVEARECKGLLREKLRSFKNGKEAREWIVKNVKGLGYKEGSHFLRNIGYDDVAIIDFHIIDILARHGLIRRPKTLTKKKYLAIERVLEKIARRARMNVAELDLYLWYAETGKVLK